MTPLMIAGIILSAAGVALALGVTAYYLSLPLNDPVHIFFDTLDMGIPYLVYFVILGASISALGLMTYIKAVRIGVTVTTGHHYAPSPLVTRRPPPPRPRPRPSRPGPVETGRVDVVEEIEKEIEEIISSEALPPTTHPPEEARPAAPPPPPTKKVERRLVEIVSKASDMVCPHCGSLNPLGSTKCQGCGRQLFTPEPPSRSCPICGAPLTLSQRISGDLFVCGICFSELRIHSSLQKSLKLR